MSTRAIYSFLPSDDSEPTYHVYGHSDGYPSWALKYIDAARLRAWVLPRYENDEFGAAFIAANKNHEGGFRLMPSYDKWQRVAPMDIEYRYEISIFACKLFVKGFRVSFDDKWKEKKLFALPLDQAIAFVAEKGLP